MWGGSEHLITALVWASSEVWRYFEECNGAAMVLEAGDRVSGVKEGEDGLERSGDAEADRGRLGMGAV